MEELYEVEEGAEKGVEDAKSQPSEVADQELTEPYAEAEETTDDEVVDYGALIEEDVKALRSEFPELKDLSDITELNNPLRYAALRDLGLTPAEAYMATAKRRSQDTRSHLRSAHGRAAAVSGGMMSQSELAIARELFPDRSDSELMRLYKKVTK